jgi:predicted RNase H-like nuclease (RuvC/YqgF family)
MSEVGRKEMESTEQEVLALIGRKDIQIMQLEKHLIAVVERNKQLEEELEALKQEDSVEEKGNGSVDVENVVVP